MTLKIEMTPGIKVTAQIEMTTWIEVTGQIEMTTQIGQSLGFCFWFLRVC
jgi:hypothetical protein